MLTDQPYAPSDRDACLALFRSNTPDYFTPGEQAAFEAWLGRAEPGRYRVIARDGGIVACGGVAIEPDGRTASLCWGMVDRRLHLQGVGRALTEARLTAARALPGVTAVRCDTSQKTTGFYEQFGFVVVSVQRDGYAPGLDRCEMRLIL